MKLYHYTCVEHLPSILHDRVLRTTESNGSLFHEHARPDVVWLSSDPGRPPRDGWADGSILDKTRIRFTVDMPDGLKWTVWASRHQIDRTTYRGLILAGGGTYDDWYVVERPIRWDEVLEILDTDTNKIIDKEEER